MRNILRKTEWGVAVLVTLFAIYLHYILYRHAGGLWRDEVGTIRLATRPTLHDVWAYLFYDSFPAFWVMITRVWIELGLGSDNGLRLLGFLTGLFVLAALWFNARRLRIAMPLFSLLLLGLSPTIIDWGDSMRAWGWGIAWIVITYGLIWRVVESPTRWNVVGATLAAIAAVHSTYYNWVLLFTLCAAGAIVAVRNKLWKRGALVMGIGGGAAITIIPYLVGIHRVKGHYLITQTPYDVEKFSSKLVFAVSQGQPAYAYVWAAFVLAAVVTAILCQLRPSALGATPAQKDLLLFSVTAFGIGSIGIFLFLKNLKFGTQPWYYAPLMTLTALSVDSILSVLGNWERGRVLRLLFCAVVLAMVPLGLVPMPPMWKVTAPIWKMARVRMTNTDMIAQDLEQSAGTNDLIVVNPWYCGISFQYYYKGKTPWTTLPALEDHTYHCYEPVVALMKLPDQMDAIRSVLDRITQTLKSSNRVWLVGDLMYLPNGGRPPPLPAAPNGPYGWWSSPYQRLWSAEAGSFVQAHAVRHTNYVVAPSDAYMNGAEFMPLGMVQGWKDK